MYGATEVGDIAYECSEKHHWHVCEEVIVEIVDPATGKNMNPGQLGEVVVTRPNETFFLFRFGTGDLSSLITDQCFVREDFVSPERHFGKGRRGDQGQRDVHYPQSDATDRL